MNKFEKMTETIIFQANKIRELEEERDLFRNAYNEASEKIRKLDECVKTYEALFNDVKEEK